MSNFKTTNIKLNEELKHLSHFLLKGSDLGNENEIVAVTKDNKIIPIFKDDVFNLKYDYSDSKLYLYFIKDNQGGIYLIDLTKETYTVEILYKPILNIDSLRVFDNKVYFISESKIKMINNGVINLDIDVSDDVFEINEEKGLLLYNHNNNIYEYNINLNKTNLLFEEANIRFLANNKLVLTEKITSTSLSSLRLKEYDYDTELVRTLGDPSPTGTILKTHHNIFPKNSDYYILGYSNRINIIKRDKAIEMLTLMPYTTDTIIDLFDDKIFTFSPGYSCDSCVEDIPSGKRIFNLNDATYIDVDYIYSNPLYTH
jgi:hypothetical protein